jgi:hypothetical protein
MVKLFNVDVVCVGKPTTTLSRVLKKGIFFILNGLNSDEFGWMKIKHNHL